ncbi:hypothetical protein EOJ32_19580 (plasmid) [Paracoccus sp. Arc7-R13]|uniref:hypothetical protein n=1 Tax=Paracoccus sp. Arc7-R13 TaxID=2500532 RepID=UPI000FD749FF|nr:hypothetical protein [Paracoccus sp. Arc7-R13]AZY95994.1 hypothetical protein EOJ32_19580 [Paracoccus sp. Arc7-R13]
MSTKFSFGHPRFVLATHSFRISHFPPSALICIACWRVLLARNGRVIFTLANVAVLRVQSRSSQQEQDSDVDVAKLTFHIFGQLPFMRLAEKTETGLSARHPRHRPSA